MTASARPLCIIPALCAGRSDSETSRHLSIMNDLLPEVLVYFKEGLIAQTVAAIIAKKDIPFQEYLLKKWDKKTKLALRTVNIIEDMYLSNENNDIEDNSVNGNPPAENDFAETFPSNKEDPDREASVTVEEESPATTDCSEDVTDEVTIPSDNEPTEDTIIEETTDDIDDGGEETENEEIVSESNKIRKERLQDINEGLQKMNSSIERINHFLDPDNVVDLKTRERGKILKQIERQMLALQSLCDILEEITESRTRE